MQARLEIKRFPSILVAVVFALAATLLLGGALGYALKPAAVVSGATHVIVVPASPPTADDNSCARLTHRNVC
jgi:hypothetical protein